MNSVFKTQLKITCLLEILRPCWYAITSKGFRSASLSTGPGNHLDIHQHNHGISGLVQFKDTQIKLSIHMIFTMLLHLKNHVVLVGFFMSQVQKQSIQRKGVLMNPRGGKGSGRDSVHFMYHNDNSNGHIRNGRWNNCEWSDLDFTMTFHHIS